MLECVTKQTTHFQVLASSLKSGVWVPFFMFLCSEAMEMFAFASEKHLISVLVRLST